MDIRLIQGLLGHHSIRSTVGYAHLTSGTLKNVHALINKRMADL